MRHLVIVALLLCPAAFGQTSTKTAKIEELFRLTKTDQLQKQMMTQMSAMLKQQTMNGLTPEQQQSTHAASQNIMDFVSEKMGWEAMKPDFIKLYDDTYTEDEISGILLFYESPPGKAMLAKTPVLMTNTMALIQKRMADIKPELDQLIKKGAR